MMNVTYSSKFYYKVSFDSSRFVLFLYFLGKKSYTFLDALASLAFKLSVSESVSESVSQWVSDFFWKFIKCHNLLIFQARRSKFCMVVDLDLLYLYLASVWPQPRPQPRPALEVNISNGHNLLIFQARRSKFCMVVDYIYQIS